SPGRRSMASSRSSSTSSLLSSFTELDNGIDRALLTISMTRRTRVSLSTSSRGDVIGRLVSVSAELGPHPVDHERRHEAGDAVGAADARHVAYEGGGDDRALR